MSVNIIAHRGELRKENGTWKWAGVWAFNSLPKDASLANYNRKAKNPSVRPFLATWEQPRSADNVLVPTSNDNMEEKEETSETEDADMEEREVGNDATSGVKSITSNDAMEIDKTLSKEDVDQEKSSSTEIPVGLDHDSKDAANEAAQTKEETETSAEAEKKERSEEKPSAKEESDAKETEPVNEASTDTEQMNVDDSQHGRKQNSAEAEGETKAATYKNNAKGGDTYASTSPNDPDYTEAYTLNAENCPPDGQWSGYFENASLRKDRNSSRVQESFCLFFNAKPAKDARVWFRDTDESPEKTEEDAKDSSEPPRGMLPPGHIHVRGTGTNAFGIFELIGSYNVETGLLECQRMYHIIHSTPASSTPRSRSQPNTPASRGSRSRGTPDTGDGTTPARAYNTRKRQFNWRRANLSDDDEDLDEALRRSALAKKKARTDGRRSPTNVTPKPGGKTILSMQTPGGKRPSPTQRSGGGATPRKKPSPPNKENAMSQHFMKLPVAGDPRDARWRAAHFMYYQRNDAEGEDSGNSSAPSFVVYEGEMLHGDCMREGRGVCLYSNGTLYEGEWKRNKEHGNGTLYTIDRKRVIYKGEWERGRMHGQGTYYYNDNPMYMRKKLEKGGGDLGSRYEGDFKENARHGVGRYVLPNGSVYDGEWRDNVMSGRGTFYWVDGSVYTGQWKDGKRHGQGTLQTSDGFTYDGQWVRNAMEGRGIATYPNGQRYEGLWVGGRREGRGTINFTNGAVYEGRFRDDFIEGQGTMKMGNNVSVPRPSAEDDNAEPDTEIVKDDWMIPIHFQSDMGHIHQKAGFTSGGD